MSKYLAAEFFDGKVISWSVSAFLDLIALFMNTLHLPVFPRLEF
jgi:hypothetical protein